MLPLITRTHETHSDPTFSSMRVNAAEKVGIVGRTGAGKSSVVGT